VAGPSAGATGAWSDLAAVTTLARLGSTAVSAVTASLGPRSRQAVTGTNPVDPVGTTAALTTLAPLPPTDPASAPWLLHRPPAAGQAPLAAPSDTLVRAFGTPEAAADPAAELIVRTGSAHFLPEG
jgi:hypothetical protein